MMEAEVKSITKVYVVHGYTASSEQNWYPWLKNQLEENNVDVTVFDMPNSDAPNAHEWDEWLDNNITCCNESTILIGHSLGCIALLRYLNRCESSQRVRGIVLVSGFLEPVAALPELDSFSNTEIDFDKIINMAEHRLAISAPNDTIVAYEYTDRLSKYIDAKLITIEQGGHFIDKEGTTEFPALLNELYNMM